MERSRKNRIISRKMFRTFLAEHPEHRAAKAAFDAWYKVVERAHWENFGDVRETFADASHVGRFVVFNVGGNKYRIITEIRFGWGRIYIRHVLTHREYDRGSWKT